jgi:hypothetical protein
MVSCNPGRWHYPKQDLEPDKRRADHVVMMVTVFVIAVL